MKTLNLFIWILLTSAMAFAGPTKVGNGDDGADLEDLQKIDSGIIITTQDKAAQVLKDLNTQSIPHLGGLRADVMKSDLFLVQSNVQNPKDFDGGLESSSDGKRVFARTMPEPLAPVRFFPSAMTLTEDQLVRLHIHESLHHILPESLRENESVVSDITLAICSPQASRDQIDAVVSKYMPPVTASLPIAASSGTSAMKIDEPGPYTDRIAVPSSISYSYQSFNLSADDKLSNPITALQTVRSYLHPFGGDNSAFGFGLGFGYISTTDHSYMGPFEVSARFRFATVKKFDLEAFAEYDALTLSNDELKSLPSARDTATTGISVRREADLFYTENYLSYTLGNEKTFTVGGVSYKQTYAPVVNAHISFGGKYRNFFLGAMADFLLTESSVLESSSGSFSDADDKERVRVLKVGPQLGYNGKNFAISLYYQTVVDSTPGYNLSDIADLMGQGSGQGYVGTTVMLKF